MSEEDLFDIDNPIPETLLCIDLEEMDKLANKDAK